MNKLHCNKREIRIVSLGMWRKFMEGTIIQTDQKIIQDEGCTVKIPRDVVITQKTVKKKAAKK